MCSSTWSMTQHAQMARPSAGRRTRAAINRAAGFMGGLAGNAQRATRTIRAHRIEPMTGVRQAAVASEAAAAAPAGIAAQGTSLISDRGLSEPQIKTERSRSDGSAGTAVEIDIVSTRAVVIRSATLERLAIIEPYFRRTVAPVGHCLAATSVKGPAGCDASPLSFRRHPNARHGR